MHPDDVMSGAGAAKLGGRFVPIGKKALYVSDSEETPLREISGRKRRLGGKALIDLDKYPRVTFRIDLKLDRHISFVDAFRTKDLERIRRQCLDVDNPQLTLGACPEVDALQRCRFSAGNRPCCCSL